MEFRRLASGHPLSDHQACTGRGIHGLPKVPPGLAMPNSYTPCGRVTPKRPSSSPLDTPSRTGLLTTLLGGWQPQVRYRANGRAG
jgi:hypothetical protein